MTMPKKGSRKIVVDDVAYRWRLVGGPVYEDGTPIRGFIFRVELAENPGSTLTIIAPPTLDEAEDTGKVLPVTPSYVAWVIRLARIDGWKPDRAGAGFEMGPDNLPDIEI